MTIFLLAVAIIGIIVAPVGLVIQIRLNATIKKMEAEKAKSGNSWRSGYGGDEEKLSDAKYEFQIARIASIVGLGVAIVFGGLNCIYTQDAGDVVVLRSVTGTVDGMNKDAGLHFKAPWQDTITYDQRNNVISFVADGEEDYTGGSANGPQVTVNDSGGASADVDIQVNYSLDPDYAMDLYRDYGSQETFVRSVVAVDVRSIPRTESGQFDTITMLNNRGEFAKAIEDALSEKWSSMGLIIEQVSVQDVRYNQAIEERYNQAQEAEVAKQQAQNEQETAKVQAETQRIEAQGEADANAILQQSLTDDVLMQHYIDKLGESKFIVVPQSEGLMLDLGSALQQKQTQ